MANYQYTTDLIDDVLDRAGEVIPSVGASPFSVQALKYINRAYLSICAGGSEVAPTVREDWLWLRAATPGSITMRRELSVTANLTEGSTSGTFTVAPTQSWAGDFLQAIDPGGLTVYRIASHTASDVNFTLADIYLEATGAKSARLFRLAYALSPAPLRLIAPMRCFYWQREYGAVPVESFRVHGIDFHQMQAQYPLALTKAVPPAYFAMLSESSVMFNAAGSKSSDNRLRIEYDYLQNPSVLTGAALEEPLVPLRNRKIIADIALAFLYADKNDVRLDGASALAATGLQAMANAQRAQAANTAPHAGVIFPRQSGYRLRYKWVRRGAW